MTKWILGGLLCALALSTGTASGAPLSPELEADYQLALSAWGVTAPPQCTSVDRQMVPRSDIQIAGASGEAWTPDPDYLGPCYLRIASDIALRCERWGVMLHEVGHLLGYPHSSDPRSPMDVEWSNVEGVGCRLAEVRRLERELQALHADCRDHHSERTCIRSARFTHEALIDAEGRLAQAEAGNQK